MLSRVAVGLGLLLPVCALLVVGLRERPSIAATNTRVLVSRYQVMLAPHELRCQQGEYVPRDAAVLRVFASTTNQSPGPALNVALLDEGRVAVSQRRVAADYPPGPLLVRLAPRRRSIFLGHLCVRNLGGSPVFFAGNRVPASPDASLGPNLPGQRQGEEIRADYLRDQAESYVEQAGSMARRFPLLKAGFMGPWTMWACLAVSVLLGSGVLRAVLRNLRST